MFERKFANPLVAAGANKTERYSVEELRALVGKKEESEKGKTENFEKRRVPNGRKDAIRQEKEMTLDRRRFLIKLGLVALGVAGAARTAGKVGSFLAGYGADRMEDIRKLISREPEQEKKEPISEQNKQIEDIDLDAETILEDVPEDTKELKKYIAEKKEEIEKLFDFNSNRPIKLTEEISDKIKNEYWRVRYEKGNLRKDYDSALERMRPYDDKLEKVFEKESVPAILKNISIAESHFIINDVSRSGAVGPFQFMSDTGRKYGLWINPKRGIDERKDPVKSGQAAAKCMRDLYINSKGVFRLGTGDWNIATAGYNGSFIWPYLEQCNYKRIKPNYDAFLKHFSERATRLREQIKKDPHLTVRIKKGDNLWKLNERFGISVEKIKKYNKKKNDTVKDGEVIKIPFGSMKERKLIYGNFISGYMENFMYVPKVNAVLEMRKQGIA